jgi:hypothetical protein
MFWRKTREAIGRFHPEHQRLALENTLSMSAPPGEWALLLTSLSRHADQVKRRKWRLPSRARTVLVPLVQVLSEDAGPGGAIGVTADLRGPDAPGKAGPKQELPVRHPIRKLTQWFVLDPWLRVRAELRDGSVLEVSVTDRTRHRQIRVMNRNRKLKFKHKKKTVQRIDARRTLPRGVAVRQPASPPPRWIGLRRKDGKRTVLTATAKLAQVPDEGDQLKVILTVVTEVFRWTRPDTARRTA